MFEPGHRALRKGRACQPGGIYLITFTTAGRNPLFRDSALAMVACGALDSASNAEDAASVCWVLMPDHFHALVQLGEATSLTRWVQRLKALATRECHRAIPASDRIWSKAFHDHALREEEDVLATARYVFEQSGSRRVG
ncbi:MAG TPA: transposase [Rhodanobacteraceae bacterium]|nr:transposase [Rhodanobacteraceae bacterium]